MAWFVLFAAAVFGFWFWREHKIQQQDLQSATSPHRTGERYIGQVLTLNEGLPEGSGHVKLGNRRWRLRGGVSQWVRVARRSRSRRPISR